MNLPQLAWKDLSRIVEANKKQYVVQYATTTKTLPDPFRNTVVSPESKIEAFIVPFAITRGPFSFNEKGSITRAPYLGYCSLRNFAGTTPLYGGYHTPFLVGASFVQLPDSRQFFVTEEIQTIGSFVQELGVYTQWPIIEVLLELRGRVY